MDRYLISGAIFVLVFEVAWFLNDFKIIHVPIFDRTEFISFKPSVGKIQEIKKGVRRRAQDSIVWEESNEKDVLYNFDSVLTLPQSSAMVTLKNETKITMSENTLILIENQEEQSDSKVRLRFAKGDMRAVGAAGVNTEIATEEWTVDAQAGSELNLRQVEGGKVEVEVIKGEAKLKNEKKKEEKSITQGKVLSLEKDKIVEERVMAVATNWVTKDGTRLYTFNLPALMEIEWSGEAESIWHLLPDRKVEKIKIHSGENRKNIELESGTHSLRLERQGTVSKTIQVSVWPAPVMHLLSPLPRDRVRPGEEVPFSWNGTNLAKSYKLQFSDKSDFSTVISETAVDPAFVKLNLKREGPFHWRIIGVDDLGYQIPPLYSNPLYNYKDLLDAPVIKSPKARQPANKNPEGASFNFIKIFFEFAQAAELYDVIFEWEPVNGAEHYTIEIDKDGTFRRPITMVKSESPKFLWQAAPIGKYFWRVSAGRGSTLGKFSSPQLIDLAKVLRDSTVGEEQGITLKPAEPPPAPVPPPAPKIELPKKVVMKPKPVPVKIEEQKPEPPPAPVVEKKEEPKPEPKPEPPPKPKVVVKPPPAEPKFQREYHFEFYLGAGYDQKTLGVQTNLPVKLSDFLTKIIGFNMSASMPRDRNIVLSSQITTNTWKSKQASEFPAQSELSEMNWRNNLYWEWNKAKSGLGLSLSQIALLERAGLVDQVKFTTSTFIGVVGRYAWGPMVHEFSLASDFSDRGVTEIWLGNDYKKSWGKFSFHVIGNIFTRSGKSEPSSSGIYIAPALGIEW